jgi:hypothetical protein
MEGLIGKTVTKVYGGEVGDEYLILQLDDGRCAVWWHYQTDYTEYVRIEEVAGGLRDLHGKIVHYKETENDSEFTEHASSTWTFYDFTTTKGTVTFRWLGESNGYYSEAVDTWLGDPQGPLPYRHWCHPTDVLQREGLICPAQKP